VHYGFSNSESCTCLACSKQRATEEEAGGPQSVEAPESLMARSGKRATMMRKLRSIGGYKTDHELYDLTGKDVSSWKQNKKLSVRNAIAIMRKLRCVGSDQTDHELYDLIGQFIPNKINCFSFIAMCRY